MALGAQLVRDNLWQLSIAIVFMAVVIIPFMDAHKDWNKHETTVASIGRGEVLFIRSWKLKGYP
jgi:hypothetical protein